MSQELASPPQLRTTGRVLRAALIALLAVVVAGMACWGTLFLYYSNLPNAPVRTLLATLFALCTSVALISFKNRRRTLLGFLAAFAVLVIWFFAVPPSNHRNWEPEVAVLPTATIDKDRVTIRNIRNFEYRTATDFTPRYYDKTFDLASLDSTDLICVYWGSPAIAHVMTSFGFRGGDFVVFSIETRKERGEAYSPLAGFFRHYELTYVVADERDVVRVRTNYREPREQVYIYRTRLPRENQRRLFLAYAQAINRLAEQPAWYNTLQDNCTTGVLRHASSYPNRSRYNWKTLLSGYSGEYAYDIGLLDRRMPFAQLRDRCMVDTKAQAADQAGDFSRRIREGLPAPEPMSLQEFLRKQP